MNILFDQRFVGFLKCEIVFNITISLIDAPYDLTGYTAENSLVNFIIAKEKS
jgi:hypothetical protein